MILSKKILKKINKYTLWRYENKYNCKVDDIIEIPVTDLSKNSHEKITIKCSNCGKIYSMKYQTYIKNTHNEKYELYCSKKECTNIKRKLIINEKYGVDNVFQIESTKSKIKETNNEKYGVDNPQQNKEIKERTKQTNIKKYGYENVFQNEKIKEKIRKTNLDRYGVEYPSQSEEIRNKGKKTTLKNYGVEYHLQNINNFNKMQTKSLKIKKYNDTELYYQGSFELDFLEKFYNRIKIENGFTIKYQYKEKEKIYHPDFYLPELDLIVEIKSSWWLKQHKERCEAKEKATKKNHNYIMVLDKNYKQFNKLYFK